MSYQNAQRVPAWKRLGLKLKGAASGESPAPASSANATPNTAAPTQLQSSPGSANVGIKRKQPPSTSAPISRGPEKRQRTDEATSSPKKSVKFTEDTKVPSDKPTEEHKKAPKKPKEKKKKTKPAAEPAEAFNLEPSLAYLRQWHTDRESWKFNKNHQTLVIKYFFDVGRIPAADVPIFLAYIRDLKGFVRTRLREEAVAIRKKDMADGGAAFSQVKEKADREKKQELYEEVLSKLLLEQQEGEASSTTGIGKRNYDETEFTAQDMDVDVKQQVIKRMRAENVLQELSESEQSTTSDATSTTTTTTSSAVEGETAEPTVEKRAKLNDGTQQVKRRRLRKSRTADISDDSSSESESESDSDSDSTSSSSDDEDDEEMPLANGEVAESSSSSSSSDSESEDDSDSESESGAGAKVGTGEDESSSESDESDDE